MNAIERLPRAQIDATAAALKASASSSAATGARLYAELGPRMAEDPELVALASQGLASLPGVHLFAAVHYLLLRDSHDPLAQYYATLTESPKPSEQAFPEFARFCKAYREQILQLLKTRTIQMTIAERCQILMPPLSYVADRAGEPLNLIEIGCSAGLLLAFDKFAYQLKGRGVLHSENAPLTLGFDVRGGPELHIPKIGKRIGLDLRPVDVKSEDERRWLLAQFNPESREYQARLATALDAVARTDIRFLEGDALDYLPDLIAENPGPLCVYHANCVLYWSPEARAALERLLLEASRGREFFRVEMEPDLQKIASAPNPILDIVIGHYRNGAVDSKVVAHATLPDLALFKWED
ncbi:MAG TPA: DUF2332 domain-containing protein [Rhizomicrobium sp.]|nr:DUF2332 domain-containing protein [Rhizomicrobium sp.]